MQNCIAGVKLMHNKLKEMKESAHMTTKELSIKSGIPESTISRILSGQTESPYFSNICDMVVAMGGSVDDLIDNHNKREIENTLSNALIDLYERELNHERKLNKTLLLILVSVLAVVLTFLLVDILNGNMGYIRY